MGDKPVLIKPYDMVHLRFEIAALLAHFRHVGTLTRLVEMTKIFLGRPYLLEPIGEGQQGHFDQAPPFWLNEFDCVTLVNMGLALMRAQEVEQFELNMKQMCYHDAQDEYLYRTHYSIGTEWNTNAHKHGWVNDVTENIVDENEKSVAEYAITLIDRPNWFQSRKLSHIRLLKPIDKYEGQALLRQLQQLSFHIDVVHCHLPYLPLSIIFDAQSNANETILSQIPDLSIIEIVRPNWDMRKEIGTHLNVSHLGFAFRNAQGELIFRHASSLIGKVVELPLTQYLRERMANSTIKGINVQKVLG